MIIALYILSFFVILLGIYIFTSLRFVKKIQKQLENANLEKFKAILNTNYQFRYLFDGSVRYKWYKKFAVIKADFKEDGTLQKIIVLPMNIFKYFMKTYLIGEQETAQ